ncbi:MAG TPA: hypothetical protein ENF70_02885 [Deltaproteobacteria bacterium]|nr:phage integrase N-terminal SAM-like domain-containing protein [Deltaproteobacteria bacterium]HDH98063.1 hypothetical protein [Deltaproteobacteria bacterium]
MPKPRNIAKSTPWVGPSFYCQWISRYIQFFRGKIHPRKFDAKHIEKFLSHLTTKGNVAVSTLYLIILFDILYREYYPFFT